MLFREPSTGKLFYDLAGQGGNALALAGCARQLARQMDEDPDALVDEMLSGSYDHVLAVFERAFPMVTLLNAPGAPHCSE